MDSLKSTLKPMLKRTLKRQIPYLIGGTITGIIMSYYYGFIVSIAVNSAIWFVISTIVNKYYWDYTGFKEETYLAKFGLSRINARWIKVKAIFHRNWGDISRSDHMSLIMDKILIILICFDLVPALTLKICAYFFFADRTVPIW